MAFINRSELNELFPATIYMKIGSYLSSPIDILHTRLVSYLFKELVSESACRAFLASHASIIERSGFYPSAKTAYENFKECILFLQYRESKDILQRYPVYPDQPSFVLIQRIARVFHEDLETVVENQVSLNLRARELFSDLVFPSLSNSHPVFRVMTMQRDEESRAECHNRVWRWLLSKPEEIKAIYSIFHLNIQPNVPSCRLLSFIPFEITRFSYLKELTLDGHLLTEVPVFLRRLQSLRTLNLQNNHITDVYCPFREMASLTKVNLTNNCLTSFPSKDLFHPNRPMILIIDPSVVLYADKPDSVFCDFNIAKLSASEDNIMPIDQAVQDNLTLLQRIAPSADLERLMQYYAESRATPEDFLDKLDAIQARASELMRQHLFPKRAGVQEIH